MKKYFTKYLPAEGQIQEGSLVLCNGVLDTVRQYPFKHPNSNTDPDEAGYDIVLKEQGTQMRSNVVGPVSLFLCTKDIQAGDEIRLGSVGGTKGTVSDESSQLYYKGLGGFKVIGKISPHAVWVKEGDEFTKEDVRWAIVDEYGDKEDECYLKEMSSPSEYDYIIVVCPTCKTFH